MRVAANTAQARFHRYVAVLFAVIFPIMAVVEVTVMDRRSGLWVYSVTSSLVIAIWAMLLLRRAEIDAMPLVLATSAFIASMTLIETLFSPDPVAVDVVTSFGALMVLGVLTGTLTAGSRLVWSFAFGATVAAWVLAEGMLQGDSMDRIGVRSVVALAGIVFTSALVSGLLDQLALAIEQHEHATRLQNAIATCSEALLIQTDKFAVHEALKALLDAGGPDYAYVDKTVVDENGIGWEIIADALRSATPPGDWMSGIYDPESESYKRLATGRSVVVRTSELEGRERETYARDGIQSEAMVPIFIGGEFRGSIGFVSYADEREWTPDELNTLWRASHMISAYWRRQDDQEKLRASNESKDRLLASVSHEIRTPLTAIVGLSEEIVASRAEMTDSDLDELSGIIAAQSRDLADLVEDLLVGARADSGNLSIRPDLIDLRGEVDKVVAGVRESNPSAKVIAVVGEDVKAWADPLRCRQVVRNLLTNAIKYGGDRVAVVVRYEAGVSQVLVIDDGFGVRDDESEMIFERYYRSDESPTQPGSVGIGLSVSRQLAELMDGKLAYVSSSGDSRFEFSIPSEAPVELEDETLEAPAAVG